MILIGIYIFRKEEHALRESLKTNLTWNKLAIFLLISGYVAANTMSLVLVYRSAGVIVHMGIIKKLMVEFSSMVIPVVYVVFLVVVALIVKDNYLRKIKIYKIFILIIILTGIIVVGSFFYFKLLDLIHYPNYTYSTYNIYLPSLDLYANFQVLVLIVGIISYWISKIPKWGNVIKAELVYKIYEVILIAMMPIILFNILTALPTLLKDEITTYKEHILNNNDKVRVDFPELKRQMDFIKKTTPADATIIHPTQSAEFPLIGNQPLIRYDLYPRKLVSAKFAEEYVKNNTDREIYYILFIARNPINNQLVKYPDYNVESSIIYLRYLDGREEHKMIDLYTPLFADTLDNLDVGLIKLK